MIPRKKLEREIKRERESRAYSFDEKTIYQYTCSIIGERKTEIRVNRTLMEKTLI